MSTETGEAKPSVELDVVSIYRDEQLRAFRAAAKKQRGRGEMRRRDVIALARQQRDPGVAAICAGAAIIS